MRAADYKFSLNSQFSIGLVKFQKGKKKIYENWPHGVKKVPLSVIYILFLFTKKIPTFF